MYNDTVPPSRVRKQLKNKKNIGRIICVLILIALFSTSSIIANSPAQITVTINSHSINFPDKAVIKDERVMVPLRGVFELVGATVTWNEDLEKITVARGSSVTELFVDSKTAVINGQTVELDVAPYIVNNKTMIHVRIVQLALGNFLEWDEEVFAVNIWDEYFVGADKITSIIGIPSTNSSTPKTSNVSNSTSSAAKQPTSTAAPKSAVSNNPVQTINLDNGSRYVGQVVNEKFHGNGKLTWADGSSYDGQWRNGLFHGAGTYIYSSGDQYTGEFNDGKQHGIGTYTYSDGSNIRGLWQNGRCVDQY